MKSQNSSVFLATSLQRYQLADPGLTQLTVIVRGADTGRPELAPQAAGLLAVSLGLSALIADDHVLLQHGMVIYDALYAWCRSWGHDRIFPKEHAKGGVNKPVAIQFNLATELRNKKSLFLQSEAKPLRKRSFVQHAEPAALFA
jgi:hypothetical protein